VMSNDDLEAALTRRAWLDPGFADQLQRDPRAALALLGVHVPEGVNIDVRIQCRDTLYFAIPPTRTTGRPDSHPAINQFDLWSSGDSFVWILPERLKVQLLELRQDFLKSRNESPSQVNVISHVE